MKHLLIDFENIQPDNLNKIRTEDTHVWLFLGVHQQKNISLELCESLCRFGKKVHFIHLEKSGKNALDFYLAYYLGRITEMDPEAQIGIVSKDGGYDVLVEHLNNHNFCDNITRIKQPQKIESDKIANNGAINIEIQPTNTPILEDKTPPNISKLSNEFLHLLVYEDTYRPRGVNALTQKITRFLRENHPDEDDDNSVATAILHRLQQLKFIHIDAHNLITYQLSPEAIYTRICQAVTKQQPKSLNALHNTIKACTTFMEYDKEMLKRLTKRLQVDGIVPSIEAASTSLATKQTTKPAANPSPIDTIITYFYKIHSSKQNKPKSIKALENTLQNYITHFKLSLSPAQVVQSMRSRKLISVNDNNKITAYHPLK